MLELKPISLVFADDQEFVREGFVAWCSLNGNLKVVGQCGDGLAALQMIQTTNPDFAVIDLTMPKLSGLEVIRKLREANNPCKLVVLSGHNDEQTAAEALRAGADGYIPKDDPPRRLLEAIQYIQDGGVYISPIFRPDLMLRMGEDPLAPLSKRERQVFYYLVRGSSGKDIANMLDISQKTVATFRAHIMEKLGVDSLAELVQFAIKWKLLP